MDSSIMQYNVRNCSKCLKDTTYCCASCPCDLCLLCKETHVQDLKTIDHDVMLYREKFTYIPEQEKCAKHPGKVYKKYCELCQVPVCIYCRKHRKHKQINIIEAYKKRQRQHNEVIKTIRSEALFYRPVLLTGIKADFKTCQNHFSRYQTEMLAVSDRLQDLISIVLNDLTNNVFCDFNFKHRCLKQRIEIKRHISVILKYEQRYEQSSTRPLKFLTKRNCLPKIHLTLHTSQLSLSESLNKKDLIELLSGIQINERGKRCVKNESVLKLMPRAEFHQSLTVKGVRGCHHISFVTSDLFWVSENEDLILSNTTDSAPYHLADDVYCYDGYPRDIVYNGVHTVNNKKELIYIDCDQILKKLSNDRHISSPYRKITGQAWKPQCVYCSPFTGDLLVGMHRRYRNGTGAGKIFRYNQAGKKTQTIENSTEQKLFTRPNFITENNNGDVVVSDYDHVPGAVVVTELGGRHRFSFTGHPPGSKIKPLGICTDVLSHILVCNYNTHTILMIDKDGQFLSHLLIRPSGIFRPQSLSYDIHTHLLWVGAEYRNKVYIYRYISRRNMLTDVDTIQMTENEKPNVRNECQLKLVSPPKLLQSINVKGVDSCGHISCVTPDRVWVSDQKNLVLTNTTGDTLKQFGGLAHVEDDEDLNYGLHTVNRLDELIYIDDIFIINTLSKDFKTTTRNYKTTNTTWIPQCVYWSPSTSDLLVGMCNAYTGKVTRYNKNGKLTQTIQRDNKGLDMYIRPLYLTVNNNGDVVVSDNDVDSGAVVVTNNSGKQRFVYIGPPSGSGLFPCGICIDALSHILVCDDKTKSVHMIDKDGQFLSYLLKKSQEMQEPWSLSYDFNTHCVWVGSQNENKLCVYRHITNQDDQTGERCGPLASCCRCALL